MNSTIKYSAGIILIVLLAGYFMLDFGKGKEVSLEVGTGDALEIVIGMKNYNYYPNTVTINVGQPVSLALDSSVVGCFRDFTIRDLGLHEYLRTPEDKMQFTVDKPGTYTFACSMGMGSGKLVVK